VEYRFEVIFGAFLCGRSVTAETNVTLGLDDALRDQLLANVVSVSSYSLGIAEETRCPAVKSPRNSIKLCRANAD